MERKWRKLSKRVKEGMVKKVEDEPVSFSVTNHAPAESFWEKSKRIKQRDSRWTGQTGQWGPFTKQSSDIDSQVRKVKDQSSSEKDRLVQILLVKPLLHFRSLSGLSHCEECSLFLMLLSK